MAKSGISRAMKARVYLVYKNRCFYCSAPAQGIDHIVPVSRGGRRNLFSNLVAACNMCNAIAGARVFGSLREKKRFILSEYGKRG